MVWEVEGRHGDFLSFGSSPNLLIEELKRALQDTKLREKTPEFSSSKALSEPYPPYRTEAKACPEEKHRTSYPVLQTAFFWPHRI